jgi:HEAT repeat protein
MHSSSGTFSFLVIVATLLLNQTALSQPNIPREKIPQDIAPEIKKEIEALYSKDATARGNAAIALREFRPSALKPAIPFLMGMLGDNAKLQISSWTGWGGIPTSPGEEAAKTLGKIGEEAVPPLSTALADKNRHVRKSAVVGLGATNKPSAVDPLLDIVKREQYSDVISAAIHSLGQISSPKVVEPITTALDDDDWNVRNEAAEACQQVCDKQAVPALLRLLGEARSKKDMTAINNAETALSNITHIYGSDKDKEWEQWAVNNLPAKK